MGKTLLKKGVIIREISQTINSVTESGFSQLDVYDYELQQVGTEHRLKHPSLITKSHTCVKYAYTQ